MRFVRSLLVPALPLAVASCGRTAPLDLQIDDAAGVPAADAEPMDGSTPLVDATPDVPSFFPDSPTEGSAGPCNAMTCPVGCCAGDTCVTNFSPDQCGYGGQACVQCPAGQNCKGTCFQPQPNCGPSNCAGCCLGSGDCAPGTSGVACGTGGQQCTRCLPSEGTGVCVANKGSPGGTCTDQQCGPQTCPSGCCSNGVCLAGSTEAACGQLGGACQTCGPNTFCYEGNCKAGTPCTPQNCNGCCNAGPDGGICFAGTDDTICGSGGLPCTDCQNANQVCVNGLCGVPCSPSTCHGCCDGNICAEGDQNFLCGAGGGACTNCEPHGQACVAGTCQ